MALQVWLPLNGNSNNQGVGDCALTISNMKYSTCTHAALCKTGGQIVSNKNPMGLTGTISFWLNVPSDYDRANGSLLYGNDSVSASAGNRKWSLFLYPDITSLHSWGCMSDTSTSTNGDFTINGCLTSDEWNHVAVAHDLTNQYIYVNGELIKTVQWDSSRQFTFDVSTILISQAPIPMSDVRIYNECLSPKQIKQLSQGLVAHYKLAGDGGHNICPAGCLAKSGATSLAYDIETDTYTIVSPAGSDTWGHGVYIPESKNILIPYGESYRISFEVLVPTKHTIMFDYNNVSADSTVTSWGGNDNDLTSSRLGSTFSVPAGTWTKIVAGSKNAHASNTSQVALKEYSKIGLYTTDDTEATTWYIRNFKIEYGESASTWSPYVGTYGYVDKEYDLSGNGYHLDFSATKPKCKANSLRYSSSYQFENDNTQYLRRPYFDFLTSALTFSVWAYQTDVSCTSNGNASTIQFLVSQGRDYTESTYGYGANLTMNNGTPYFYIGSIRGLSSNTKVSSGWHMITGTWDGTTAKIYVDGVLKNSGTVSGVDYGNSAQSFVIGKMAHGYTSSTYFFPYVGYLNDVRVYSKALTSDDILELYKQSAFVDNYNCIGAYEFVEEE